MKKILTLCAVFIASVQLIVAADGGTASDPYLNVAKYETIDEAGANVDGMQSIYKYTPQGTGYWLTVSCYGAMKADESQNWITNTMTDADNGSQYTGQWVANDIFQGPEAYFGENTPYSAKFKMPTKEQCYYVTFCEQVKLLSLSRSTSSYYLLKMEIFECTDNGNGTLSEGTNPIETIYNSTINEPEVFTSKDLDPEKIYKVKISNSYSYLFEIGFKTPGFYDGPIITPVAYDATNVLKEHATMTWTASPGARSYTLRTYPATFDGLIYREKFSNFTNGLTLEDYQSLDAYTDHPEWMGYGISGADGGVMIENNGSITSPLSDENGAFIPCYQKKFTLKFKAKPAEGVTDGQLLVSLGSYSKTFDISGPEKYYTFVIERGLDGSTDYMSGFTAFFNFKNTYFYNPNDGGEEEDHRIVLNDFKIYLGDYSEPTDGTHPKWVIPAWDGDTTFVKNIPDTTFTFGTNSDQISHFNGIAHWVYDVKAVYYGGQESDWSNKIYYSTIPFPVFLEDDDDPIIKPVVGDVNGDGEVTSFDITLLYNWLLNNDDSDIVNGDQDGDGEITANDITTIYTILIDN